MRGGKTTLGPKWSCMHLNSSIALQVCPNRLPIPSFPLGNFKERRAKALWVHCYVFRTFSNAIRQKCNT
uniref:Uncharacterized protein n=1 Tax=Anguilla anguilla TaxID=7936 RepID=A0A0E9WFD5_ANGAN